MADEPEKSVKVYVRMTKDYPEGMSHSRGGLTLGAGPVPIEASVTESQLAELEGDPMVQIVDEEEYNNWQDRIATQPEHPTSDDLKANDENRSTGGRNYGGDGGSTPGQVGGSADGSAEGSGGAEGNGQATGKGNGSTDGLDDLNFKQLQELAGTEEVDVENLKSKDAIRTAIRAKRTETAGE